MKFTSGKQEREPQGVWLPLNEAMHTWSSILSKKEPWTHSSWTRNCSEVFLVSHVIPKSIALEPQHQRNISLCRSRWHWAKELSIASVAAQGRVQMCCVFTDHSVIDDGEDSKVTCQVNRHPGCLVTTRIIKAGWIVKPDAEPVHPEGGPKLEKFKSNGC